MTREEAIEAILLGEREGEWVPHLAAVLAYDWNGVPERADPKAELARVPAGTAVDLKMSRGVLAGLETELEADLDAVRRVVRLLDERVGA